LNKKLQAALGDVERLQTQAAAKAKKQADQEGGAAQAPEVARARPVAIDPKRPHGGSHRKSTPPKAKRSKQRERSRSDSGMMAALMLERQEAERLEDELATQRRKNRKRLRQKRQQRLMQSNMDDTVTSDDEYSY
jgi:hypothetical protein